MTDIGKKFRMIIENEDLFKSNPEAMLRLKYLVDNKKSFKNSEIKAKGIFSLPLYPDLKITTAKYISKELKKILKHV